MLFLSGAGNVGSEGRKKVGVSLGFVGFVGLCGLSGAVAVGSVCWSCMDFGGGFKGVGFKGFVVGLVYGLVFVFKKRWIIEFPIVQRPLFFSFKMGIPSSARRALKLSCTGYLISTLLAFFLPNEFKSLVTLGKFLNEQILLFIGVFVVFMCWELSLHLHQVLHTKRYSFAPPKGSAAAETNPSEPLLAALEESTAKTLLHHLAYLDLYMVCEGNASTWRRAAFFEESGETYKRVIAVCLRPLEQLALELGECVETDSVDAVKVSSQLMSPTERVAQSRLEQAFYNIQLCTWSAGIVASLTVHSRREDRFGVAQLTESNAAVVSTLISCLLAVELCMGKKTNVHSAQYLMGPAGIKWATLSNGKRDPAVSRVGKRKGSPPYSKAYVMADILRTSIYRIVSAFHKEMVVSTKSGLHDKDWIIYTKPCYGSRELVLQKLNMFLNFEA